MEAPDKIFVREYPDGLNQFWNRKKREDVVATTYHEYVRKDAVVSTIKDYLVNWLDPYKIERLIDKIDEL